VSFIYDEETLKEQSYISKHEVIFLQQRDQTEAGNSSEVPHELRVLYRDEKQGCQREQDRFLMNHVGEQVESHRRVEQG